MDTYYLHIYIYTFSLFQLVLIVFHECVDNILIIFDDVYKIVYMKRKLILNLIHEWF